jgi:hypothetical protein
VVKQLFFFHNPKAGGTSVVSELSRLFAYEQRCPRIENDATEHAQRGGRYAIFRGYDFYAGHYGADIHRALDGLIPAATNFRWPIDRVVSVYRYFRHVVELTDAQARDPRFTAVRLAKTLSLDDFVACDDPAVRLHTNDHHFRQLTGSGWSLDRDGDMRAALSLVDRMIWFYVCEHPYESLAWAETAFEGRVSSVQRLNVTRARDSDEAVLSARAYRHLVSRNQNDIALYQHALDRMLTEVVPAEVRLMA